MVRLRRDSVRHVKMPPPFQKVLRGCGTAIAAAETGRGSRQLGLLGRRYPECEAGHAGRRPAVNRERLLLLHTLALRLAWRGCENRGLV